MSVDRELLRGKMILLDDKDAPFMEAKLLANHVAEVLVAEEGEAILLNKEAIECAIETLQEVASCMESDPDVGMPMIYDRETLKPWELS